MALSSLTEAFELVIQEKRPRRIALILRTIEWTLFIIFTTGIIWTIFRSKIPLWIIAGYFILVLTTRILRLGINKFGIIGKIVFESSSVQLQTKNFEQRIPCEEIDEVSLRFRSYDGKVISPKSISTEKGNNNWLGISHSGSKHNFRIYITENDLIPFNNWLTERRNDGVVIKIRNSIGFKVSRIGY